MGEKGISRRSFLKWSAGALASVALLEFERPARAFAAEAGGAATLSEIPASAEQIARESPLIKENMAKLDAYAASLKESGLRTKVQGVLENLSTAACPRPSSSRRHARTTIRAARIWESRQRFFVCVRPLYQMLQKHPVSSAILDGFPGRRAVRCSPG